MPMFTSVAVVGMYFRGAAAVELASALSTGEFLTLEREPENPYDAYAIKVLKEDIHIGYIEHSQSTWISPLLDEGHEAECVVEKLEQRGKNLHPIVTIVTGLPSFNVDQDEGATL